MLILGHRGARRRFPENTVRSLLAAIEDGADGVELDVRMSRDGQLVVRHDDRLAGGGEVSGLTLQALREQEATVPTLDEAMSALDAAHRIVVEVKPDRDRTGDLVERVVSHLGGVSSDVVVVSSFDPAIVGAIRRTVPAVSTGLLAGRVDGLAELLRLVEAAEQAGHHELHLERRILLGALGPRAIEAAAAAGMGVVAWTVNEVEEAGRLRDMGVCGLITDLPGEMVRAFQP